MNRSLRHIRTILLSLLSLLAVACSSDGSTQLRGIGTLTISVVSDTRLLLPSGELSDVYCPVVPETDDITLTITDTQDVYSHTWESFGQFRQNDDYFAGTYTLTATSGDPADEGFATPAFTGETTVSISEDARTDAVITLTPASTFMSFSFSDELLQAYPGLTATASSRSGGYITVTPAEDRLLCLNPGGAEVLLTLPRPAGEPLTFRILDLPVTKAATIYNIELDLDPSGEDPVIMVTEGGHTETFTLSPAFLACECPVVTFSETALTLPEGDTPSSPVTATVTSSTGQLSSLLLTTRSASLRSEGLPEVTELLDLVTYPTARYASMGLKVSLTETGAVVDFTELLGNLVFLSPSTAVSDFWLIATDSNGFTSSPVSLSVTTTPVEIEVMETSPSTMCIDRASVTVLCAAPGFDRHVEVEIEVAPGHWEKRPLEVTPVSDGCYRLSFDIPEGSHPVNARVLYCEEIRSTFSITRVMPEFTISVDTYARNAMIEVNPADPSLRRKLTERLSIYVNGTNTPVYRRYPDEGRVLVIGLNPATTYSFAATIMEGVDSPQLSPAVRAVTERTPQLPNPDFEERRNGPTAKDMPSGGLYARTAVNIFNWQHHTDFNTQVPKGWANTNDKTFNLSSKNINTWYVQPSVFSSKDVTPSGAFSVQLTSVAFDPDGEQIPPYSQTGTPYLDYSPIVPTIRYRAAGKLFLGEYRFDRASFSETYKEGISWTSRPSSISGNYRFLPASNGLDDRGLVKVEILGTVDGKEEIISSASLTLPYTSSFTSFNIPLTYLYFGVKATRIKVMFASSTHIGSIEEETRMVPTLPDPLTASSTGARLWIDDIRVSY